MQDLEIGTVELQPNYGPHDPEGVTFGGQNCIDSNLKTSCRPDESDENRKQSAISLEFKELCFKTSCPEFDIKSITIYTPTVAIQGQDHGTEHKLKVILSNLKPVH